MEGIYSRRIKRLITCLLLMGSFSMLSAGTFEWTGVKDVAYNGTTSNPTFYKEGWSKWSTEVPTSPNNSMYVRAKVYIPVKDWGRQSCADERTQTIINVATIGNNTVRKEEGSYTKYNTRWSRSYSYCGGPGEDYKTSYSAGCKCWLGSTPTGYCVISGVGVCGEDVDSNYCGVAGYTQPCTYIVCQQTQSETESGCNNDFASNSDQGCGKRRTYCYYTTSSFLDYSTTQNNTTNAKNWRASLSAAGGYAKEVYVYSYPTRVYIDYNGNGNDKICGNGETASWSSGSNSDNANSGIKYVDGNPVCSTSFTTNTMKSSYIDYANGGNLKANQYYKIGSDFKGWSLTPNGPVLFNKDGQKVTSQQLKARPGERITLYAQWQKHNYKVTYSYLCGNIQNVTYKYGEGVDLDDLNTTSCKTNNPNSNASFLGWYEDIGYTKRLEKIPTSYYKDITLYAKIRETRFFNYKTGNWEYTK